MSTTVDNQFEQHTINIGRTFCWHQIFAPSSQASLDFYTQALDWGTEELPMGEVGTYKMLTANGAAVAGVIGTEGESCAANVPPHWSVSIGVDDVDKRLAKCVELGAAVIQPAFDIPTVGRVALMQDPQGAQFWLFTPQI